VNKTFGEHECGKLIEKYYRNNFQKTKINTANLNPKYELYCSCVHANLDFLKTIVEKYENIAMRDKLPQFVDFIKTQFKSHNSTIDDLSRVIYEKQIDALCSFRLLRLLWVITFMIIDEVITSSNNIDFEFKFDTNLNFAPLRPLTIFINPENGFVVELNGRFPYYFNDVICQLLLQKNLCMGLITYIKTDVIEIATSTGVLADIPTVISTDISSDISGESSATQ
jgi:hypothetical protein